MPVKTLHRAKQRLAGVLAAKERVELARAMAEDVLSALAESGSGRDAARHRRP